VAFPPNSLPSIQCEWFLKTIQTIDRGFKVMGPAGIIHSTEPRITAATDDNRYFLRGPLVAIVVAETILYMFAGIGELPVPDFTVTALADSAECRYILGAPRDAPVAQLDRAFDYESKGRTFESCRAHHKISNLQPKQNGQKQRVSTS
jgi:hypothetical protein